MNRAIERALLTDLRPDLLAGNAAWYDISDINSLRNNAGAVPANGDGIKLIADKSGNSAVNVLALNGLTGSLAEAPDAAPVRITGDIDLRARVSLVDWTPAARNPLICKWGSGGFRSYLFTVEPTTGVLELRWSADGSTAVGGGIVSTLAPTVSDLATLSVRVTLDVDDGAGNNVVKFYTSTDTDLTTATWTQLGTTVTTAGTSSIFNSSSKIAVGANGTVAPSEWLSGNIYRAQIYNGIAGTLVFDANFATFTKLAATGTESSSNAATVTINTTGDLGARISGARDAAEMTAASQGLLTIAASGNYITTDGTNDYYKSPAFSLPQPVSFYGALSQVTWSSGDYLLDGNAANTLALIQTTGTPQLNISAGSSVAANTGLAVATRAVVTIISNGASSYLRINRGAATTGNAGAGVPNGITIGASATPGSYGNGKYSEILVRAAADDIATQDRVALYLGRKWGIAV